MDSFKNKKVLLMGLGVLGGGVATARFLAEHGAVLTVTDMKSRELLEPSLRKLEDLGSKIKFVIGEHREADFLENEIIVINPDVPADNKFVKLAREHGKQIENELTLFYKFCPSKNIIAVTGTRGKTTTANWIAHFVKSQNPDTVLLGNSPDKPFLQEIEKVNQKSAVVIELPSYHLEIVNENNFRPKVAVITNLYRDHLNRHKTMQNYASAKANIFRGQKEGDYLILNDRDSWTPFFIHQNQKSKILFFSVGPGKSMFNNQELYDFEARWGKHNVENLLASSLAASTYGVSKDKIMSSMDSLPHIKFREEKIYDDGKIQIYNDTAATSPEATIAAVQRFGRDMEKLILISGGTDRELEFDKWAEAVKKYVAPENLLLLGGSATEKMKKELGWEKFQEFDTLEECFSQALGKAGAKGEAVVLFSPGAKSFEKFKNEFDRGEKFNKMAAEFAKNANPG